MTESTKNNRLPPHIFERLKLAAQNDVKYQNYENDRRTYKTSAILLLLITLFPALLLITSTARNNRSYSILLIVFLSCFLVGCVVAVIKFIKASRNCRERFTRIFLDVVPPEYFINE